METTISTPNTSHTATVQTIQQQQQHIEQQQQQQQIENGHAPENITASPIIKSEVTKVDTIVTMDPNGSGEVTMVTPNIPGKRSKTTGREKPRYRTQSEKPATCPICFAVIRQSSKLRRHLEQKHFPKPDLKKEKKNISSVNDANIGANDAANDTTLLASLSLNSDNSSNQRGSVVVTTSAAPLTSTSTVATPIIVSGAAVSMGGTLTQIPLKQEPGVGCIVNGANDQQVTVAPNQMQNVMHIVSEEV